MVAWAPMLLAAAGALAAFQRERQYVPEEQANSTGGALLNVLGGGLGGFIAGGGGQPNPSGAEQAIGRQDIRASPIQTGAPRYIPASDLAGLNNLAGAGGGLDGALLGAAGAGGSQNQINNLNQLALLQQRMQQQGGGFY